jgi:hypothetical protein
LATLSQTVATCPGRSYTLQFQATITGPHTLGCQADIFIGDGPLPVLRAAPGFSGTIGPIVYTATDFNTVIEVDSACTSGLTATFDYDDFNFYDSVAGNF